MPAPDQPPGQLTRNTAYLTVASIVQKILAFAYFVVFANLIGTQNTGSFFFAVSFANLFGIFVDLGFSPMVIRDVARDPSRARAIYSAVMRFKVWTAITTTVALVGIAPFIIHDALTRWLLVLAALVMVFESFALTAYGVLRGLQRLRFEAVGSTISQVLILLVGVTGLVATRQPIWLGIALLAASLFNVTYATTRLRAALPPSAGTGPAGLPWSKRAMSPFFLSGLFVRVYAYVDTVLVGLLSTSHYVGLYGAAYRITYALQFLPVAFNTSVYPALSQAFELSRERLEHLIVLSLRGLSFLSFPIAALIIVHARPILALITPEFVDAALALQISIASVPFLFINLFLTSLLNAMNRQVNNTIGLGGVVTVNVLLNLMLIPQWQHVGASIAALASAITFTVYGFIAARDRIAWRSLGAFAVRLGLATAAMTLVSLVLVDRLPVLVSLALGGGVYVISSMLARSISRSELALLVRQLRQRGSV